MNKEEEMASGEESPEENCQNVEGDPPEEFVKKGLLIAFCVFLLASWLHSYILFMLSILIAGISVVVLVCWVTIRFVLNRRRSRHTVNSSSES